MTGGTALPADFSPQSTPGSQDQPGGTGQPASGGEPGSGSGERSSGLPRPFFADQPGEPRVSEPGQSPSVAEPYGQMPAPGPPYGQPPAQGPPYGERRTPGPAYGEPPDSSRDGGQAGRQPPERYGRPADQRSGWQPGAQQPQRPARQRSTKPPERELKQRAIASLIFGIVGLVALLGLGTDLHKGVYLLIFSAAVGIAGCVIGITALVKARKTGSYRPRGAVGGIVLGAFAALISVPILLAYLAFPTQVNNYVNCLSQAQNSTDRQACMSKFYKSIHLDTSASAVPSAPAMATSIPAYLGRRRC